MIFFGKSWFSFQEFPKTLIFFWRVFKKCDFLSGLKDIFFLWRFFLKKSFIIGCFHFFILNLVYFYVWIFLEFFFKSKHFSTYMRCIKINKLKLYEISLQFRDSTDWMTGENPSLACEDLLLQTEPSDPILYCLTKSKILISMMNPRG